MTAIKQLHDRRFNGYLGVRVPHEFDDIVTSIVEEYRTNSPTGRRAMLDELSPRAAGVLSAYGQRMATMAVRTGSPESLRRGLIGMGMADAALEDYRNNLIVLAAVNHAAAVLGRELGELVEEIAADLPEPALEGFRQFTRREPPDKELAAMGLRAVGTGDEFRYV